MGKDLQERIEDLEGELEQRDEKIRQLEGEIADLQDELDDVRELESFRELVRVAAGLHWDAGEHQIIARVAELRGTE